MRTVAAAALVALAIFALSLGSGTSHAQTTSAGAPMRLIDFNAFFGQLNGNISLRKPTQTGTFLIRLEWSKSVSQAAGPGQLSITWEGQSFDPITVEFFDTTRIDLLYRGAPPTVGTFNANQTHKPLTISLWRVETE